MFDYYNLEPLLMWIHSTMCSLMPEWMAFTIEGIAVGVFIMVMYAVLAIILIYMERKVCAAFQCRIGPDRVGGRGGLLQVPADVIKILTKEIISLKNSDKFSCWRLRPSVCWVSCWRDGAVTANIRLSEPYEAER